MYCRFTGRHCRVSWHLLARGSLISMSRKGPPPGEGLRFILHLHQTVRTVVVEAAAAFQFDALCSARRNGAEVSVEPGIHGHWRDRL